jgi:hypothetical protein
MQATRTGLRAWVAAAALLPAALGSVDTLHAQGATRLVQPAPMTSVPAAPASAAPASAARLSTAPQDCRARWEASQRSQGCFAPYRSAEGGMKPEAFTMCGPDLPDPSADCGPLR